MWDLIVSVPDHCLSFYFAGMTLDKCAVLRIGTLTGANPGQGESLPVQVKEPYSSFHDYL